MRGKRSRPSDDVWNGHGGYMGIKKQKLVQQFQQQAQVLGNENGIFTGVSIFVNGWTTPSADELKRIMMNHGGTYHHYYNSHKTTHIIASNLPDVKMRQLKGNELIVKPEWISACLEAERLLDYKPYLLFSNKSKANKITNFTTTKEPQNKINNAAKIEEEPKSSLPEGKPSPTKPSPSKPSSSKPSPSKPSYSPFKAKDAKDPKFLGEFFQNSRLHHISTMGANAKEYVNQLRDEHTGEFPARDNLTHLVNTSSSQSNQRTIMHIDMDCFFVSVVLRNNPQLVGKPVAVCHAKGNKPSKGAEEDKIAGEARRYELQKYQEKIGGGDTEEGKAKMSWKLDNIDGLSSFSEVASCSYEARAKGVKNGMFLGPALKLCPDLKTIPYDFAGYEEVSKILYDTVASYTLDIQAVSCDEMFVDLTDLLNQLNMDPLKFCSLLRDEIKSKTKCCCSVGLGSSILVARMATKKAKPDGQYLLKQDEVLDYMGGLSVKELPGVGRSLERKLASINITTCANLQRYSLNQLQADFGKKTGAQLYNFCRGIDDRKLELQQVRKTVSAEVNYGIRFSDFQDASNFLHQLSEEVSSRLRKIKAMGKSITLKLMLRAKDAPEETSKFLGHGVCDSISRSIQVPSYTSDEKKIFEESMNMLKQVACNPSDIRGIGISLSKLDLEEKKLNTSSTSSNSILKFMKPSTSKSNTGPNDNKTPDTTQNVTNKADEEVTPTTITENRIDPEANLVTGDESNGAEERDIENTGLDPEVLASLPEEIRQEVLRDYGRHVAINKTSNFKPSTRSSAGSQSKSTPSTALGGTSSLGLPDVSVAGPSRQQSSAKNEPSTSSNVNRASSSTNIMREPSFAEIDQEVLDALPPDLRAEICQHYGSARDSRNTRSTARTTSAQSPGKFQGNALEKLVRVSPSKRKTPVKKRRGRPPKYAQSTKTNTNANKTKAKKKVAPKQKVTKAASNNVHESQKDVGEKKNQGNKSDDDKGKKEEVESPTFCGKSSLEEIRPLIKAWLKSTDDPVLEDVQMLVDYLQKLIFNQKMHVVSILIKCLYRNICLLSDRGAWPVTYTDMVDKVQLAMKSFYGHTLYVEDNF